MAYNLKSETEVKEYLENLGIEYRFGCYSEKKPEVCHLLADYLEAIKKDFEKARRLYKSTCDDYGYGKSCFKYGVYSLLGKASTKEDYKQAFEYFQKGCDKDVADACFNEGLLRVTSYEKCQIGRDYAKGMAKLEKGCELGNANGCYYASGYYIRGFTKAEKSEEYEVAKDMERAFKLAVRGCDMGNIYCCVNLSQMYKKGEGVEKNEELSTKYRDVALEMQSEMEETNKTLTFQEGL